MVVHTFNPITQETEAGRSLWVLGQPGQYGKNMFSEKKYFSVPLFNKKEQSQENKGLFADV